MLLLRLFVTRPQAKLCQEIALALGFDLNKGRLDVSVHPFTGVPTGSAQVYPWSIHGRRTGAAVH